MTERKNGHEHGVAQERTVHIAGFKGMKLIGTMFGINVYSDDRVPVGCIEIRDQHGRIAGQIGNATHGN